ncbi:hypothetical protein ACFPA8_07695 [Streptomyces ovatisporus]|uniref:Integral membrane protein n=1 Tax=Streptomyces ovatisporus TaxID=1128682 RepID=A0ABV9A643_9ACTN
MGRRFPDYGDLMARQELEGYVESHHRKQAGDPTPPQLLWASRVAYAVLIVGTLVWLAYSLAQ